MTPEPALNKTEVWIAEHSIRILFLAAVVILLGGFFIVKTFTQSGEAKREVDVLKPQVTRIVRAAATCSAQTVKEKETSNACAARLRFALIVCRRSAKCRAALLAIVNYPPPAHAGAPSSTTAPSSEGGDAVHQPSNQGHQSPGPGKGPSGGDGGNGQGGDQEAAPTPSPGASAPPAPGGGPPAETPGNGAQGASGGSSSSGAGVEVCAELVNTCVGAEVGLGH